MTENIDYKELGNTLHDRLLARKDNRVTAEIAEIFLPLLLTILKRRHSSHHDPHDLETAAHTALMAYLQHPETYNPAKLSLLSYLRMSAEGDLKNIWRKEKKSVELELFAPEYEMEATVGAESVEARLIAKELLQLFLRRAGITDSRDCKLVMLMLNGERKTSVFAEIMDIQDRSPKEQQLIVKQHKDRLKKALERALERQS